LYAPITDAELANAKEAMLATKDFEREEDMGTFFTSSKKGVSSLPNKLWVARIWFNNESHRIGVYSSEDEAARAWDDVAVLIRGRELNFRTSNLKWLLFTFTFLIFFFKLSLKPNFGLRHASYDSILYVYKN
jgi:hypothetical protein